MLIGMRAQNSSPSPIHPGDYGPLGRSAWQAIDWREHQRWVSVGGQALNVIDVGVGDPPIIFIHSHGAARIASSRSAMPTSSSA